MFADTCKRFMIISMNVQSLELTSDDGRVMDEMSEVIQKKTQVQ